jgi:hypothetical protein
VKASPNATIGDALASKPVKPSPNATIGDAILAKRQSS